MIWLWIYIGGFIIVPLLWFLLVRYGVKYEKTEINIRNFVLGMLFASFLWPLFLLIIFFIFLYIYFIKKSLQ
jgi:hypothetical protein